MRIYLVRLWSVFLIALGLFWTNLASAESECKAPIAGKEGFCAPDFQLRTLDGKTVRLSQYQGKVVFLNFWATWCQPCAVEIPAMDQANQKMKGKPFVMLAASIDTEGPQVIEDFFQKIFQGRKPSFAILLDQNKKVSERYGTFKVPETYIIDRTGRIRDKVEGIKEWDDSLILHYLELLSSK